MVLTDQLKRKVLKEYLGDLFYVKVSDNIKKTPLFLNNVYVVGNKQQLREYGCRILLSSNGRINYDLMSSYEIVSRFFRENAEEDGTFYHYHCDLLILYHFKGTFHNKRLNEMVSHVLSYRRLKFQNTVLLSETEIIEWKPELEHYIRLGGTYSDEEEIL